MAWYHTPIIVPGRVQRLPDGRSFWIWEEGRVGLYRAAYSVACWLFRRRSLDWRATDVRVAVYYGGTWSRAQREELRLAMGETRLIASSYPCEWKAGVKELRRPNG